MSDGVDICKREHSTRVRYPWGPPPSGGTLQRNSQAGEKVIMRRAITGTLTARTVHAAGGHSDDIWEDGWY